MKHFFDIGANIGDTFGLFLNGRPEYSGCTVWCFEPSPRNVAVMLDNIKAASGRYKIILCPFGLSGTTRTLPLFEMENGCAADSFFDCVGGTVFTNPPYRVMGSVVSITDFLDKNTAEGDDITLKVDCEGSEFEIYDALLTRPDLLNRISTIYNEWHPGMSAMNAQQLKHVQDIVDGFKKHNKVFVDWMF